MILLQSNLIPVVVISELQLNIVDYLYLVNRFKLVLSQLIFISSKHHDPGNHFETYWPRKPIRLRVVFTHFRVETRPCSYGN